MKFKMRYSHLRKISDPNKTSVPVDHKKAPSNVKSKLLIVVIGLIFIPLFFTLIRPLFEHFYFEKDNAIIDFDRIESLNDECSIEIVESIPENLTYSSQNLSHESIYTGWNRLLDSAKFSIDIASSYWTLRSVDTHHREPSAIEGETILKRLIFSGKERNISIRIVQNQPSKISPDDDTILLSKLKAANVRSLNMTKFTGAGILHTKLWIVDGKHFYIGSGNMDWRSLTQVKELGVIVYNCSKLAIDMQKIFEIYWAMSKPNAVLPKKWPKCVDTSYNMKFPMKISFNKTLDSLVYLSSSPPQFSPEGRSNDIDAIISAIDNAKKFVHIAVMDYVPLMLYSKPMTYWSKIDDKLREVSTTKKISVKLLISRWPHSPQVQFQYLKSLSALSSNFSSVQVKLFKIPCFTPDQCKIPYARVNHNKYMVTDETAYIGTSNWSGDYFVNTGGIGFVLQSGKNGTNSKIRQQLQDVFNRDWNSRYAEYF